MATRAALSRLHASVGPTDVGAAVTQVALTGERTCVVTVDGGVCCWAEAVRAFSP